MRRLTLKRAMVINAALFIYGIANTYFSIRHNLPVVLVALSIVVTALNVFLFILNFRMRNKRIIGGILCPKCDESKGHRQYKEEGIDDKGVDVLGIQVNRNENLICFHYKCYTCGEEWGSEGFVHSDTLD